jgi:hypothetical protein
MVHPDVPDERDVWAQPFCLPFGTTRNAPRMNGWMRQKYV